MNREILFRGKRVDNGEWIEGYFVSLKGDKHHYILTGIFHLVPFPIFEHFAVSFSTVGQYTGLTDKNGRRIFEGDILKHDSGTFHEVVFEQRNGKSYFGWVVDKNETWHFDSEYLRQLQVVGNIHDDPELLEENHAESM